MYILGIRCGECDTRRPSPFPSGRQALEAAKIALAYFRMPAIPFEALLEKEQGDYCQRELQSRMEASESDPSETNGFSEYHITVWFQEQPLRLAVDWQDNKTYPTQFTICCWAGLDWTTCIPPPKK